MRSVEKVPNIDNCPNIENCYGWLPGRTDLIKKRRKRMLKEKLRADESQRTTF